MYKKLLLSMSSDILFSTVEKFQGVKPWGRILDAGTGVHSLKWIQNLTTDSITAITADNNMKKSILNDPNVTPLRSCDSLIVGNWMEIDDSLGKFDTILADYLIGAVDGFSPYEQDTIIDKLKHHLNDNGRLYIIGMNPIPDNAPSPADLICELRKARDACILLAGHRPYREFPIEWMARHLKKSNMKILKSKNFTILHSEESAKRQLKVAQSKLSLMAHNPLRAGMESYLNDLNTRLENAIRSTERKKIPLSFDYVICVEIENESNSKEEKINETVFTKMEEEL